MQRMILLVAITICDAVLKVFMWNCAGAMHVEENWIRELGSIILARLAEEGVGEVRIRFADAAIMAKSKLSLVYLCCLGARDEARALDGWVAIKSNSLGCHF